LAENEHRNWPDFEQIGGRGCDCVSNGRKLASVHLEVMIIANWQSNNAEGDLARHERSTENRNFRTGKE